jgi:predicted Fe-Mo cluster-binding NifX family protein
MKLAIPLFGTRISPRFDCAQELLIFTIEDGKILKKEKLLWRGVSLYERIAELGGLGVNIVICGAVDGFSHTLMHQRRIGVYSWVTGNAEKIVEIFLRGELQPGMILMPGGRRGRWRCGRRAGWRWKNFHP